MAYKLTTVNQTQNQILFVVLKNPLKIFFSKREETMFACLLSVQALNYDLVFNIVLDALVKEFLDQIAKLLLKIVSELSVTGVTGQTHGLPLGHPSIYQKTKHKLKRILGIFSYKTV